MSARAERGMAPGDLLLALVVIVAWGLNFVVIRVALNDLPPMLLGALRFVLAAFPAVLLVRRPALPWRWLIGYGLTISLGQFVFLFQAMAHGMPAGLASLVLQSQALFTLFFAAAFLGEPLRAASLVGLAIAAAGLVLIGLDSDQATPLSAVLLTLGGGAMWGAGNIITRRFAGVDQLGLVVWGALVPPLPFLALSLWWEGPALIASALRHMHWSAVGALLYLAFVATLLGYGLWSRLLSRYPAGKVAPFSLLVPVVGLSSAALLLDERLGRLQWIGGALVMAGLAVNVFGARWLARRATPAG